MKKKVLMIIPRLAGGGAERVVSNLTIQLKEKYEIDILLDYEDVEYPYAGRLILLNPGIKKAANSWKELAAYVRKAIVLWKMKRRHQYDCYISHSDISHILNIISGNGNCDIILTLHHRAASMRKSRIGRLLSFFARHYFRQADRLVAVSEGVRREYIRDYHIPPDRIVSIWNGSDIAQIEQKKRQPLSDRQREWFQGGQTAVTMGRLCVQKGQSHLIRAFSEVVKKIPDCRLLLLGGGELQERLMQIAKGLHIEKNIIFCGFQKNPFSIIANSDIFVFSSLEEGFGYALEEAICCGVPCISSDFPYGAREILHYGDDAGYEADGPVGGAVYTDYGVLVPVCRIGETDGYRADRLTAEEEIMADAIVQVLRDKAYRERVVSANNDRLKEFSLERMGERWSMVIG